MEDCGSVTNKHTLLSTTGLPAFLLPTLSLIFHAFLGIEPRPVLLAECSTTEPLNSCMKSTASITSGTRKNSQWKGCGGINLYALLCKNSSKI